jgi:hypothetical protein
MESQGKVHFWFKGREPADGAPPRGLTDDDDIVALDNTAFFENNEWNAEFVVSVYSKLDAEKLREKANKVLEFLHVNPDSVLLNRIGQRSKFFFALPQINVEVSLRGNDNTEFIVGPTEKNGILATVKRYKEDWQPPTGSVIYSAMGGDNQTAGFSMQTNFDLPNGWGIISGALYLFFFAYDRYRRYSQSL